MNKNIIDEHSDEHAAAVNKSGSSESAKDTSYYRHR